MIGHELRTVVEVAYNPDVPRAVPVDRGSLGLAQGALVAGPLYVAACGAAIAGEISTCVVRIPFLISN